MDLKELRLQGEKRMHLCVISGFRLGVNEIRALLGFYAAQKVSFIPTFRDNISVPLKMGPIGYPETSARNYPSTLRTIAKERGSGCI